MEDLQKEKLFRMTPLLAFLAGYFMLHYFDWKEATQIIWASWIGLASFLFLAADVKMELKDKSKKEFNKLNFYSGFLTLMSLVLVFSGFIHWQRVGHIYFRFTVLALLLLIYFFIMFRGISELMRLRKFLEDKK